MEPEQVVCEVTPSQVINLKYYIYAALGVIAVVAIYYFTNTPLVLLALALPLLYAFWKWLQVKYTVLRITNQRLIVTEGILNKRTNETELYRVRDSSIEEPFLYRMCGVGNVMIYTTDEADNVLKFTAFKKPHWIKDQVRNNAEICRKNNRWGNDNVLIHEHTI